MRTHVTISLCVAAALAFAAPAAAQYGARRANNNNATGENYHIEVAGTIWDPAPNMVIESESLGILGDNIDFVNTLGIQKSSFKQLKLVLRPAKKHKFRFEYTPISYMAEKTVPIGFVFNGQQINIGADVKTDVEWKAYRFGYEYDFLYKSRGFAGLVLDLKYTDIQATLTAAAFGQAGSEFTHAQAPIPAIGGIGRVYVIPNISVTGEFTFFKLPNKTLDTNDYSGHYYDFDLYGTVNFNNNFGAQVGFRSFDVFYKVQKDTGQLKLKGPYFGGVVRF